MRFVKLLVAFTIWISSKGCGEAPFSFHCDNTMQLFDP